MYNIKFFKKGAKPTAGRFKLGTKKGVCKLERMPGYPFKACENEGAKSLSQEFRELRHLSALIEPFGLTDTTQQRPANNNALYYNLPK